jgi:hypothetical protein
VRQRVRITASQLAKPNHVGTAYGQLLNSGPFSVSKLLTNDDTLYNSNFRYSNAIAQASDRWIA